MLRYTLRQMRASLRHLLAAATAIVVSTGFVAAALVGSGAMNDVLRNLMTLRMADGDLLVRPPDITPAPPGVEQSIKAVDGVEDTYLILESWGDLAANGSVESVTVQAAANSPQLTAWPVTEGAEPTKAGEVSLAAGVARRLG
ncbi:MAG: hypothetical protein LBH68_01735 [Bifidobacteriaceae bacterium]|jgi:hypothetical protein|nr:hypothetical protein [Bifidobacteriaceae bacterium]